MNSLIREVNNAVYQNIEDVVAFVKWLDDELCFLVSFLPSESFHFLRRVSALGFFCLTCVAYMYVG